MINHILAIHSENNTKPKREKQKQNSFYYQLQRNFLCFLNFPFPYFFPSPSKWHQIIPLKDSLYKQRMVRPCMAIELWPRISGEIIFCRQTTSYNLCSYLPRRIKICSVTASSPPVFCTQNLSKKVKCALQPITQDAYF